MPVKLARKSYQEFQDGDHVGFSRKTVIFFFSFIFLKYELLECFHPINATAGE